MPTELDTMKHAKEYIDKLANGIDPFTGKPIPDDDIVNNVKLSRCFFYISGILEKVIKDSTSYEMIPRNPFSFRYAVIGNFKVFCRLPILVSFRSSTAKNLS